MCLFIYQTLSVSPPPPHLGVSVGKSIHLQLLDEVKVWIGGDMRPSQSRLPELRFILAAVPSSTTVRHCAIDDQSMLGGVVQELVVKDVTTALPPPPTSTTYKKGDNATASHISLYSVLHEAEVSHLNFSSLSSTKVHRNAMKKIKNMNKCKDVKREEITRGRCSYGGFRSVMSAQSSSSYL